MRDLGITYTAEECAAITSRKSKKHVNSQLQDAQSKETVTCGIASCLDGATATATLVAQLELAGRS